MFLKEGAKYMFFISHMVPSTVLHLLQKKRGGVGRKEKREPLVFVLKIWNKHVSGYGIKWRRTKEPLDESERESEKVGLKLNIQKTKIMASGPITSWEIDGETVETVSDFIFLGSKITADGDCHHEIKRRLLLGMKVMTNLDNIFKSRDITLPTKIHLVKAMVFSRSHVWMWELDYKESWAPKKCCFWAVVLEKTLESPLHCKEIQLVHPKRNQSWVFIWRTDVEAETPILLPSDVKSWLIWKDPDSGKD